MLQTSAEGTIFCIKSCILYGQCVQQEELFRVARETDADAGADMQHTILLLNVSSPQFCILYDFIYEIEYGISLLSCARN